MRLGGSMRIVPIVLTLVLVGAVGATAQTRDGERIYTQNCARCHDGNMPQILTAAPIQEYPADRIYESMTFGFMVRQAAGLSKDEKRAVAEYVSGSPAGSLRDPLDQIPQTATAVPRAQRPATRWRVRPGTAGAPTTATRGSRRRQRPG